MVLVFCLLSLLLAFVLILEFRIAGLIASSFILFVLTGRIVSIAYIDIFGPVFSVQLSQYVGGSSSMPILALSVLIFLLVLAFVFRPTRIRRMLRRPLVANKYTILTSNIFYYSSIFFVLLLYLDMFRRGHIPLFEQMERYEYARLYAGLLHHVAVDYGFLIAGMFGYFFVYPRLVGRGYFYRFPILLGIILVYFVLTGHRYSAFFEYSSFFILPWASVALLKSINALPPLPARLSLFRTIMSKRGTWVFISVVGICLVIVLIRNSVVSVRAYDDPVAMIKQRVLIQPAELWWATWDRQIQNGEWTPGMAWKLMFEDPIDASRNTGIQYLMVKALGYERARDLLSQGTQYAGGYPEVLLELAGPYAALPLAFLFAAVTLTLLRLVLIAVSRGCLATAIMGIYVYYGFTLLYIGGMLNFLTTPTFWLKVAMLFIVYWFEGWIYSQNRRAAIYRIETAGVNLVKGR